MKYFIARLLPPSPRRAATAGWDAALRCRAPRRVRAEPGRAALDHPARADLPVLPPLPLTGPARGALAAAQHDLAARQREPRLEPHALEVVRQDRLLVGEDPQ